MIINKLEQTGVLELKYTLFGIGGGGSDEFISTTSPEKEITNPIM